MNDARFSVTFFVLGLVPYVLVSWAYVEFVDGAPGDFWRAFGGLLAARLFFIIIETLGSALSWRLYGKDMMTRRFLAMLRSNNFPKRAYAEDDFSNYLARIESGSHAPAVKSTAKEIKAILALFEGMGILRGMRVRSASEAALEAYSPRARAPTFANGGEQTNGRAQ